MKASVISRGNTATMIITTGDTGKMHEHIGIGTTFHGMTISGGDFTADTLAAWANDRLKEFTKRHSDHVITHAEWFIAAETSGTVVLTW